jgi:hypothetical protein
MFIYEAFKTAAQMSISSTSITFIILNEYYYNNTIKSSLLLIRER